MEDFNLNTLTNDKLRLLFEEAKKEIIVYSRFQEQFIKHRECIKEKVDSVAGCMTIWIVFCIFTCSIVCFSELSNYKLSSILWVHGIIFVIFLLISFSWKKVMKKFDAELLQEIQLKEYKEKDKLKATLFIPSDYRNEYAMTTMIKFIDNRRADGWKEITSLYEEHLHRMRMENNARQIIEELESQTEKLSRVSGRTGWAAAGAWAVAAGIWKNNS